MTEAQEQILVQELASGKEIFWVPDQEVAKQVVAIGKVQFKDPDEEDEPGLCAHFKSGGYVALYICEISDFVVGYRLKEDPLEEES